MSGRELGRSHLAAQFAPAPGWRLDALVGTTFGLDLDALLALLIGLVGAEPEAAGSRRTPLAVLQALIPLADRVRVVGDRTNIRPLERVDSRLLALLDGVVRDVHLERACFHPKLWVARYLPRGRSEERPRLRILCSSRNLSRAATWELFVAVDAVEGAGRTKGAGLCTDTLALLERMGPGLARDPPVRRVLRGLRRAAPLLEPAVARQVRLRHQWPGSPPLSRHLPEGGQHLLVVSPFLRDRLIETLMARFQRVTVISTAAALDGLGDRVAQALVQPPNRAWAMRVGLAAGAEAADSDGRDEDEAQEVQELDLHAKLFIAEGGSGGVTLLGSANATNAAWFGVNAEAVVELKPGLSRRGFLEGFAVAEGNDPDAPTDRLVLRPWLRPWRPRDVEHDAGAAAEHRARELLDRAVAWLASLELQGSRGPGQLRLCVHAVDMEPYEEALAVFEDDLELSFWLASRPGDPRPIRELLDGSVFEALALVEVTELVGVRVQSRRALEDGRVLSLMRLLRFELSLGSERNERNRAIFRELLSSADFDLLLRAMLSGLPAETPEGPPEPPGRKGRSSGGGGLGCGQQAFAGVTLEQLLRACSVDPSLVDDIDELVQVFAAEPERLSEDFRRIWPPLRKALRSRSLR